MVGILLKSCSPEELTQIGETVLGGSQSDEFQIPVKAGHQQREQQRVNWAINLQSRGVTYLRSFQRRQPPRSRQDPGDTLSG